MIFSGGIFFFQAEDGIRDLVRSRGLGDVYKRQCPVSPHALHAGRKPVMTGVSTAKTFRFPQRSQSNLSLIHI